MDDFDIERDFWNDEPTRKLARVPKAAPKQHVDARVQRTRQHEMVVQSDPRSGPDSEPTSRARSRHIAGRSPIDPLLARLGLIVCVGVAMVPLAMSLRDDNRDFIRATSDGIAATPVSRAVTSTPTTTEAAAAEVISVPQTTAVPSVAPIETIVPASADTLSPTTAFDISALPEATPVTLAQATPASSAVTTERPASTQIVAAVVTSPATTAAATTEAPQIETPVSLSSCSTHYAVVSGDGWIAIAKKVGVSTRDLLAVNAANATTPLYPGRNICLPQNASAPTTTAAPAATAPARTTPTTVRPTTTAVPTATVPARVYSAAEVEAIIREVWPDDLEDEAVRIARRESNLQPTARNACCYGLFQIYFSVHKGWLGQMGVTRAEQLFDPHVATTAGLTLYQRSGGWGPWAL